MGVIALALHIVWGVRAAGMVNYCGSNIGCGWVLILFCSTILVCVSVVSSLVLPVIFPWKMYASFISASSSSVPKGARRAAVAGFSIDLIKSVAA